MKKILHICNDFATPGVYIELVNSLAKLDVEQVVFFPKRTKIEGYKLNLSKKVKIFDPFLISTILRIFFPAKIYVLYKWIIKNIDVKNFDLIHAHSLYSDGGVALLLNIKFSTPYIAAVRNTDINIFYKLFPFLRFFAIYVVKNAEKIILISRSYKKLLSAEKKYQKLYSHIQFKYKIIPNGLDDYWLKNLRVKFKTLDNSIIKLIFIGSFTKEKNICNTIKAVKLLNEKTNNKFSLILIGKKKGKKIHRKLDKLLKKYTFLEIHNYISDKDELLLQLRNADIFIMPSLRETFGLVFLEALSQGLPIIYSQNQGIDGMFKDSTVGYSVDPQNIEDIANKILLIVDKYEKISSKTTSDLNRYSWQYIANEYTELYHSL